MKDTEPLRAIIRQQTEEFLAKGGKIQYIKSGVSNDNNGVRREFSVKGNSGYRSKDSE